MIIVNKNKEEVGNYKTNLVWSLCNIQRGFIKFKNSKCIFGKVDESSTVCIVIGIIRRHGASKAFIAGHPAFSGITFHLITLNSEIIFVKITI